MEPLGQFPALPNPSLLMRTCTSIIQEVEVKGSEMQGHPWLHNEFPRPGVEYVRPCLKRKSGIVFIDF